MTHLESVSFVGSYLAVAETERQGLCPTCVERRATNEHELAIANMGYRAAVTACTDQGLVYKHLSLRQMKEALLLYQRRRQVPFMAMNKAQLAKICSYARSASAVAEGGEPISSDNMDHWEMIEFLTSFCGSPCAPNGILNDASDWEEEPADQEEEQLASLDRTPLADTTNAAAWSSSTSAAAAAPRYKWSLDQATAKYEALRAALRAGVDIREQLDGKPINTVTPAQLARDIAAVLRKPSFRPVPVPPLPTQPLATPSQPSGTIEGITPLSLRCHSLDPQRQCFVGIGRLGLLYTRNQFASLSHQLEHIIDHTEEVNPGFRLCWLCSSRFCTKEDAKHVEQCGEAYFSTGPRPLTLAGLELHYCLSNATTILDMVYYMPLNVDRTVYSRHDHWQRQIYNLLTDTSVADPSCSKRSKWRLVRSYFSTGPRPLTLAGLELHYCLSNATTILDMVYYMPLNVDRTVYSRHDHWQRQIYNLLTDTSVTLPGGRSRRQQEVQVATDAVQDVRVHRAVPYPVQAKFCFLPVRPNTAVDPSTRQPTLRQARPTAVPRKTTFNEGLQHLRSQRRAH